MKRKTAALYDPYLDVMGGGEKHILSILQILEKQGYDVTMLWDKNVAEEIKNRLGLSFKNLQFSPNIHSHSILKKLSGLSVYDIFLYVTDGSYFFSSAKKNFVFCMVPNKKLYRMNLLNQFKTFGYQFISNSNYTQKWLEHWNVPTKVIYPYVNHNFIETDITSIQKNKTILSVGRFFPHLHSKKHNVMMEMFAVFAQKHPDYKLIIAGGLKPEDNAYFQELQSKAKNIKNIQLMINVPFAQLLSLYQTSTAFWHFTGYGIDENKNPDLAEHLGMTPLEAMAAGTIPFCYNAGGPRETIRDGENGFLFTTQNELFAKMELVLSSPSLYKKIQTKGQRTVQEEFSYEVFERRVINILLSP